jgi:hypothetical protein
MTWQDPQGQPDWRDAYGQYGQGQNPYGQQPYGQDPYGSYGQGAYDPYGHGGYGPYGPPAARSNGMAIGALVANIVAAFLCCGGILWIPGVITAGIAMSRNDSDPESARKLSIASWVCFAVNILLAIGLVITLAVIGAFSDSSSTST